MQNNISQQDEEINLFEYLIVVLKHKEVIVKATLVALLLSAIVSFFIPPTYQAETKVLPPQSASSSMSSLMASQMAGFGISAGGLGVKTPNDLYTSLIRTRPVTDYVIDRLDLMSKYKVRSREKMRNMLGKGLAIKDEKKSGIMTIGFQHKDPKVAAEIANVYVEGLQNINNTLAVTEASQRRLFFEEQLRNAKESLINSEENLKYFQQRTGTIKIDDEAKAVIGTVAEMRAKISAKEVQLRIMKTYATQENPDFQRLQDETLALKEELRKMESKTRLEDDSVSTVGKMSSLGTEYIRRMREFKYNESLYEILLKQYEGAKLDESKDAALIQIIEKAEVPENRIKPDRKKIVTNIGAGVFLLAVLIVLAKYYFRNIIEDPKNRAEMDRVRETLDFSQLKKDLKLDIVGEKISTLRTKRSH